MLQKKTEILRNIIIDKTEKFFLKGKKGEGIVYNLLKNLFSNKSYIFIFKNFDIPTLTSTLEIDLLLLHPKLGIFTIEVKNWSDIKSNKELDKVVTSIKEKCNILKSYIKNSLGKLPINIEWKIFFPNLNKNILKQKNFLSYEKYDKNFIFKDDFTNIDNLSKIFFSTNNYVPTNQDFYKILTILTNDIPNDIKKYPLLLSKDEILFFDKKQLSILNGYTGGLKIIRGVAGTGKTMILINFALLNRDKNILILCFNSKLKNFIEENLKKYNVSPKNIKIYTFSKFLRKINKKFAFTNIEELFEFFFKIENLTELKLSFREYLKRNKVDFLLIDETQDLPALAVRTFIDEIENCILFIDEAQAISKYATDDINKIFKPNYKIFKNITLRGRVRNLKNIYRVPSNIARCALEILSLDKNLNNYFKNISFITKSLLSEINLIFDQGEIFISDLNKNDIFEIVKVIPRDEKTFILFPYKKNENDFKDINKDNIEVHTIQSIKGLEADNIIVYNFDEFVKVVTKSEEKKLLHRKLYVLLTRAKKRIILDIKNFHKEKQSEILEVYKVLDKYSKHLQYNNYKILFGKQNKNSSLNTKIPKKLTMYFNKLLNISSKVAPLTDILNFFLDIL